MTKNKAGFIMATYEGVQVDWLVIIADDMSATIDLVKDGKKMWMALAQWLTLLPSLVEPIQPKKRGRPTESTPNQPSK